HSGGLDVPARREAGRAVGAGASGVLAERPGAPAPADTPRGPDGGDFHRRRGPGLPGGPAPARGRVRRRRLPDQSRRGRDHQGKPGSSSLAGSKAFGARSGTPRGPRRGPASPCGPTPPGKAGSRVASHEGELMNGNAWCADPAHAVRSELVILTLALARRPE